MSIDPTVTAYARGRAPRSASISRTAPLALTALALMALTVGCASESDEPFEAYTGLWKLSADTSQNNSRLTCPTLGFDEPVSLFTEVNLVPGTLSDLYETAGPGNCQFAFDVVPGMNALDIVTPDPFTGVAAQCIVEYYTDPAQTVTTLFFITPTQWDFNLQPSVKGKAPAAQLVAKAQLEAQFFDITVDPPVLFETAACTYNITANLDKVSQP